MKAGIPSYHQLRNSAIEAAHSAGAVLMKNFGRKLQVSEKPAAGLVTNVDLAAEAAALKVLRRKFPKFAFLTEEQKPIPGDGSSGRFILDPLDGTTNYVHRFPMFCVSIAAEWEGQIVAGVIYHPVLDETYVAVRGKGATVNKKKIQVSKTSTLKDALLTTGFTYRKEEWLRAEMESFERLSGIARAVRRPGSAALDLAYTARGVFDGFWERRLSPWDIAAGSLLVEEAGGRVTDFEGKPFRVDTQQILATNQPLHQPLLQAVNPQYCPI